MVNPAAPIAVVLTAIPVEYEAMREHLLDIQEEVHEAGTIFHVGSVRNIPWQVVLAQTGQGNQQAAVITERAIRFYQPDLVILVGVAGRLHDDLRLGDVVVAKKVYAIHGGLEDDTNFRPRPEAWMLKHRYLQRAERIAKSSFWRNALSDQLGSAPKAVVRPIASGEVVLDSEISPLARMIREHYDDACAIEMEGAGVALASQLNEAPVVVLRGISDYADGRKEVTDRAGGQQRAARNAAAFAVALLAELVPERLVAPPENTRAVVENLLSGEIDQQILAVKELGSGRHTNAVPLLVKGFYAIGDTEVTCRIIWTLDGMGTASARNALQDLKPRHDIERLVIRDALDGWQENLQ